MKKKILIIQGIIVLSAVVYADNVAQNQSGVSTQTISRIEQFLQDSKKPVPWISLGGDLRIRNEYMNNVVTLDEDAPRSEQDYFRFRGRIWATVT
ncbi:MAG TPA: hypothetical protein PLW02_11960, partial [Verrucomicrobiota bacterium]|nr:hypothetical protein [Verrucomicrobiota bacterium]